MKLYSIINTLIYDSFEINRFKYITPAGVVHYPLFDQLYLKWPL